MKSVRFLPVRAHRLLGAALAAVLAALPAAGSFAQADFPSRPLRLVVPFTTGGGNDIAARIIGAKLAEFLGQQVLIENKPGANGVIGVDYVKKASPDGYTVLVGSGGPMLGVPATYSKPPYRTLEDFAPITMLGSFPLLLTAGTVVPARSVQELVAHAKQRPADMTYGSAGTLFQLSAELLKQKTGTEFRHIPYKGSAGIMNALVSGEVTIAFIDPPAVTDLAKAGKLRVLAVTSPARHPSWPDVPTLGEAGIPDMAYIIWIGLFAPARTPGPVVKRIAEETARALAVPDVRTRFAGLSIDPSGMPSDEFARVVARDLMRWSTVAETANIKVD